MRRALVLALVAAALPLAAQESRPFNPIARPGAPAATPTGAVRISPPVPVPRERVEGAVNSVVNAWNAKQLRAVLGKDFPQRDQLADALSTAPQKDARLRVVAIQSWQVIDQYRQGGAIVSRVTVSVRTQVEFNDAAGFQRRDGINDWTLTLRGRGEAP